MGRIADAGTEQQQPCLRVHSDQGNRYSGGKQFDRVPLAGMATGKTLLATV